MKEAAAALVKNDLPVADSLLRAHLAAYPTDVAALRMLAEVAGRLRRYADAQELLERCLELAPSFDAARHNYAVVLNRQAKPAAALPEVERLLAKEPDNPGYLNLKAAILANMGDYGGSIEMYERVLRRFPRQPKVWMSMGHAPEDRAPPGGERRRLSACDRDGADVGRGLLESCESQDVRFSEADAGAMQEVARSRRSRRRGPNAFRVRARQGARGRGRTTRIPSPTTRAAMRIRRQTHPYSADENTRFVSRCKQQFTARISSQPRRSQGAASADPIFIVGLPRAGSTLLEQILASHSPGARARSSCRTFRRLRENSSGARRTPARADSSRRSRRYRRRIFARSASAISASTRVHRKTDAPFFIDKMPNNCLYIGLIHLILPNAKIIDARRHPLGCCFSRSSSISPAARTSPTISRISAATTRTTSSSWLMSMPCCRAGSIACSTSRMVAGHRSARCAGCSSIADCRSRSAA